MNNVQKIVKEICSELNIKFSLVSQDWIMVLEKDDKVKYVVGYKFPLNDQATGRVCDDKYALYEVLTKFNIPNYKISSDNHVWNAVYLNGTWLHLDVTWDDPTTNTGEDMLLHDYFLIDDSSLFTYDDVNLREHTYNYDVFLEFKKAQ